MMDTRSALGSKPALTDSELAEPRGFSFLRHSSLTLTAVLVDAVRGPAAIPPFRTDRSQQGRFVFLQPV